ncbi:flagellin [Sphingomonas palmae]|uniref:Flagellin n=1 Tax=Sphingomonas palmae TaxID=1855283 RepID=A0A1H7RJD0_9SPHN|nr:flagellin [Sphingomonas palmae]SEL59934.1 flagellin [Sphingomonas palmae]
MTVINTNTSAMRATNASMSASASLSTAMERLSTGKRINSAKDDAAGLAISQSMTAQIRGLSQGIRNANDGISLAQTADGALNEVSNMLQRVRELAVQSASGTYSASDRDALQAEVSALGSQITDVIKNTKFNGVSLFDSAGGSKTINIQTGSDSGSQIGITIKGLDVTSLSSSLRVNLDSGNNADVAAAKTAVTGAQTTYNNDLKTYAEKQKAYDDAYAADPSSAATTTAKGELDDAREAVYGAGDKSSATAGNANYMGSAAALEVARRDLETTSASFNDEAVANTNNTIDTVDAALTDLSAVRGGLGAAQNRLTSVVNNATSNVTNLTDAKSRIEDADFSTESTALAKAQILSQASTAMLAQANQSAQGVLKLLG